MTFTLYDKQGHFLIMMSMTTSVPPVLHPTRFELYYPGELLMTLSFAMKDH